KGRRGSGGRQTSTLSGRVRVGGLEPAGGGLSGGGDPFENGRRWRKSTPLQRRRRAGEMATDAPSGPGLPAVALTAERTLRCRRSYRPSTRPHALLPGGPRPLPAEAHREADPRIRLRPVSGPLPEPHSPVPSDWWPLTRSATCTLALVGPPENQELRMSDDTRTGAPSEQESREVAEAARESEWKAPSFVRELFLGNFRLDLIHPYPEQSPEDRAKTDAYLKKIEAFLRENVDSDEIDRTGELPDEVVQGLRDLGASGIKIPEEYGGLGLSQVGYGRTIALVTSKDGNLTALLSAHQSIGVPQPLKLFGTPEQKAKYLPRLAAGAISAFALTEESVGS